MLFLTTLSSDGSTLHFSTYLGGSGFEATYSLAVGGSGDIYLAGVGGPGTGFPLVSPLPSAPVGSFVTRYTGFNVPTIMGRVLLGGDGVENVTMTLSGTQSAIVQTDSTGYYSFANLTAGGNYTVTPTKAGHILTPANQVINNLTGVQLAQFSVVAHTISGKVTNSGSVGVAGVTVTLSGTQSATRLTDVNGNYSFTQLLAGGNYTVTPSKPDYVTTYLFFPGANRVYNNLSANQTAADFAFTATSGVTLFPVADAHVQDGAANANTNFGPASAMQLRTDSVANSGNNQDVYFKYDLTPVAKNIASVKLRFSAQLSAAGSVPTSAYSVGATNWLESGAGSITWANRPAISLLSGATATINGTALTPYEIDVTNYVRNEKLAGRDIVSLALHNPSASIAATINSREAATARPTLFIQITPTSNIAPTVSLTGPADGASFAPSTTIPLTATASDTDGAVSKVDFYAGTQLLGTSTTSPYTWNWTNAPSGSYALRAVATDNGGLSKASSIANIIVTGSNLAPSVTVQTPANNSVYGVSLIPLSATASDIDGAISKVEFFQGTTLLGMVTTPINANVGGNLYSYNWANASPGVYTITAKATDNSNSVTTSAAITVNVVRQTGYGSIADAYVQEGASAATNFGTTTPLMSSAVAGSVSEVHLKFDISTASAIGLAKIRLYGRSNRTGPGISAAWRLPATVYPVATTTWSESTINWNNKPAAGTTPFVTREIRHVAMASIITTHCFT